MLVNTTVLPVKSVILIFVHSVNTFLTFLNIKQHDLDV